MRALLCLAFVSTTVLASPSISRGDASELKFDIAGEYLLDNGRKIRMRLVDDELYLDLNRYRRHKLLPVTDRTLASRDGKLTVEYLPDGPAERIHIRYVGLPDERLGESSWLGR
ncbi:hypothetical protein G4G28_08380 [Massilia sp. Dwa41.01b]|uniref:hypothetical protein n=1 Tax=unclassified Massilia TaxID=2609279 RepID=UPI0016015D06|nr:MULTISPECIES: hypothetical protein [unclassified Massilia]QNA88508.1 hypothetical protein G4G28_08380 [Massilia sp. Dwa41.01b]QNA99405.1 hypothetical protein G4G31_12050 [Massilia sp. Se16.2.3]